MKMTRTKLPRTNHAKLVEAYAAWRMKKGVNAKPTIQVVVDRNRQTVHVCHNGIPVSLSERLPFSKLYRVNPTRLDRALVAIEAKGYQVVTHHQKNYRPS